MEMCKYLQNHPSTKLEPAQEYVLCGFIRFLMVGTAKILIKINHSQGSNLEGKSCTGTVFRADNTECSKYYLCINGEFSQLTCPAPLHWNKNHCDWPEKAQCKTRAQLRISGQSNPETEAEKPIVACYFTSWAYYR